MNTILKSTQVSPSHVAEPSDRSVSNHPWLPSEFGLLSLPGLPRDLDRSRSGTPVPVGRSVFGTSPFPSRLVTATGRIEFVSYGPVVHLRLLSTPSCDDAVTFGYKIQTEPWWGLSPHRFHTLSGALGRTFLSALRRRTGMSAPQYGGKITSGCGSLARGSSRQGSNP